jgi:hypothetical protein
MERTPPQAPATTCTQVSFHFGTIGAKTLQGRRQRSLLRSCKIDRTFGAIPEGWRRRLDGPNPLPEGMPGVRFAHPRDLPPARAWRGPDECLDAARMQLLIGPLDLCTIRVVCIAFRGRVPIAALICIMRGARTFFSRRATGNCPNGLFYQAGFILRVSCTISGILCEPDGRYKYERCRGHYCYELHGKSPVMRNYQLKINIVPDHSEVPVTQTEISR